VRRGGWRLHITEELRRKLEGSNALASVMPCHVDARGRDEGQWLCSVSVSHCLRHINSIAEPSNVKSTKLLHYRKPGIILSLMG